MKAVSFSVPIRHFTVQRLGSLGERIRGSGGVGGGRVGGGGRGGAGGEKREG